MKTIILCFVGLIIIALVTGYALRLLVSEDPAPEVQIVRPIKEGEFFHVGRYGKTLVLETCTERTQDEK